MFHSTLGLPPQNKPTATVTRKKLPVRHGGRLDKGLAIVDRQEGIMFDDSGNLQC